MLQADKEDKRDKEDKEDKKDKKEEEDKEYKECSAYELRRRQSGPACTGYADDLRPIHTLNMDTRADRGFPAL